LLSWPFRPWRSAVVREGVLAATQLPAGSRRMAADLLLRMPAVSLHAAQSGRRTRVASLLDTEDSLRVLVDSLALDGPA